MGTGALPQTEKLRAETSHRKAKLSALVADTLRLCAYLSESDAEPVEIDTMLGAQTTKTLAKMVRALAPIKQHGTYQRCRYRKPQSSL